MINKLFFLLSMSLLFGMLLSGVQSCEPPAHIEDRPAPETAWQAPELLDTPLAAYIARVEQELGLESDDFNQAIKDLTVFDGRLYLGYGDWTKNTGPIDVLFYETLTGGVQTEFTVAEEALDFYRILGNNLVIPGLDSKANQFYGSVYAKASGGTWQTLTHLEGAIHALDAFDFNQQLFVAGSGYDTPEDDANKNDMAVIWSSADQGATWQIAHRFYDQDTSKVSRFEKFLQTGANFYVFGESIDNRHPTLPKMVTNIPRRYDQGAWNEVSLLDDVLIEMTYQFDEDHGVVVGLKLPVDHRDSGLYGAWTLASGEEVAPIDYFLTYQERIVDIFLPQGGGPALFLTLDGNDRKEGVSEPYVHHVYETTDLVHFSEILRFETSDELMYSLALWQDELYFGDGAGNLYRSVSLP
jgi:hypothetical protein